MQKDDEKYEDEDENVVDEEPASGSGSESLNDIVPAKMSNKKSKKSKKRNTQHKITVVTDSEPELDDVKSTLADVTIGGVSDGEKDAWSDDGAKKKKKTKNKKANKKSTATEIESMPTKPTNSKKANKSNNTKSKSQPDNSTTDVDHTCVTCSSTFDSKNKLFAHLKKTNHGVYIPKTSKKE